MERLTKIFLAWMLVSFPTATPGASAEQPSGRSLGDSLSVDDARARRAREHPEARGRHRADRRPRRQARHPDRERVAARRGIRRRIAGGRRTSASLRPAWWARFTLRNPAAQDRFVYLRQDYPLIDFVDLYDPMPDGGWRVHSTGDRTSVRLPRRHAPRLPVSAAGPGRGRPHDLPALPVAGPVDINLALLDANELAGALSREQLAYGIYFGCVIMLLVLERLRVHRRARSRVSRVLRVRGDVRHLHDGEHRFRVPVPLARQSRAGRTPV